MKGPEYWRAMVKERRRAYRKERAKLDARPQQNQEMVPDNQQFAGKVQRIVTVVTIVIGAAITAAVRHYQ